jgi:acyl-CoA thioester hydrolase
MDRRGHCGVWSRARNGSSPCFAGHFIRQAVGVGPILTKTIIDYKLPLKYPDTVHVSVTVTRIGGSSFTMTFRIRSEALGTDVASGEQVMVVYDYRAGATARVDDRLREAIAAVEATKT